MQIIRNHWFKLGLALGILVAICLYIERNSLTTIQIIFWLSLTSLFLHQFEEYGWPGYFPGMLNSVMNKSKWPDRYPLNTQTSLVINVFIGWSGYFLAALFADKYIWLGIATLVVSAGNIIAHTFRFNMKGKTIYNPGMFTAIFLFLPIIIWFCSYALISNSVTIIDWVIGILLGLVLLIIGILKTINWMANKETEFIFADRQLMPIDRKAKKPISTEEY